jgi:acetolactate synthase-1/2/3 large subunit
LWYASSPEGFPSGGFFSTDQSQPATDNIKGLRAMPNLYGGEALIRSLYHEGIRTVFGIPGLGQYEAIDALYNTPEIRYFSLRNEQASTYMADGYARASGEIAAALVVPGPGVLNASAGMATAYAASSPVLVVTGVDHLREGDDDKRHPQLLHELTKWAGRATTVEEVPQVVHTAMSHLRRGRMRPVIVEVPHAVLAARGEVTFGEPAPWERPGVDDAALERALTAMSRAKRPLIWAGIGVHHAGANAKLTALAEAWQAPVVTRHSGKGAISDRHPLSLGLAELRYPPLRRFIESRDLILAVGSSYNFSTLNIPVVQIDVEPQQIAKDPTRIPLVGDAGTVLDQLLAHADRLRARDTSGEDIAAEIAAIKAERFAPSNQLEPQMGFMNAIRNALPDDGILFTDMTQLGYYSRNYYPVYAPRSYFICTRLWTLGAALPMSLGAKIAQPHRKVLTVIGDGGFLYNAQELSTAMQYKIPVVIVLFNDNAYGNVLRAQQEEFDGHVIGTLLHNPDFVQFAQSFGVEAKRVFDAPALEQGIRNALDSDGPVLIEVPVGPMKRVF